MNTEQERAFVLAYRAYALAHLAKDGEVEFDGDPAISLSEDEGTDPPVVNGAYVQAWLWVDAGALERDRS